jgi:hypothetical protein
LHPNPDKPGLNRVSFSIDPAAFQAGGGADPPAEHLNPPNFSL